MILLNRPNCVNEVFNSRKPLGHQWGVVALDLPIRQGFRDHRQWGLPLALQTSQD